MAAKLTDQERQAILADITAGIPRNEIARKHGRSPGTISNIARNAGLEGQAFDRTLTKDATRAREADLAELRSQTAARFLMEANKMLDRLNEPCEVFAFGGAENRFNSEVLHRPPSQEARNFMTAAAVALDKHLVLDKHDSDESGGAAVDAWLRHVIGRGETPV